MTKNKRPSDGGHGGQHKKHQPNDSRPAFGPNEDDSSSRNGGFNGGGNASFGNANNGPLGRARVIKQFSSLATPPKTPGNGSSNTDQLTYLQTTLSKVLQNVNRFSICPDAETLRLASELNRALKGILSRDLEVGSNDILSKLPEPKAPFGDIPPYRTLNLPASSWNDMPPLPDLPKSLVSEVFTHKSTVHHSRSSGKDDCTYEKLELLGDKYIELIAMRLINSRFGHLTAGRQSQLRELLVKNETLGEYLTWYDLEKKIKIDNAVAMQSDQGNKGINKVHGDVFEAYVGALILGDEEHGFAIAEKWLTQLWAPKLLQQTRNNRSLIYTGGEAGDTNEAKRTRYNPAAKAELQKLIFGRGVKLEYEEDRPTLELKGEQLGQNRHFIALYLTGWGHEKKLLGKGEGGNKVEAGNWAATEAIYGEAKELVAECAAKLNVIREEARKAREAAEAGGDVKAEDKKEKIPEVKQEDRSDVRVEKSPHVKKEKKVKVKKEASSG